MCVWEAKKRTERRFPPRCGVSSAQRLMRLDKGIVRLALVVVVQPAARRLSRARVSEKASPLEQRTRLVRLSARTLRIEFYRRIRLLTLLARLPRRRHHLHRRSLPSFLRPLRSSCCCCSILGRRALPTLAARERFFFRYPSLWAFYFLPAAFDKNLSSSSSLFSSSLEMCCSCCCSSSSTMKWFSLRFGTSRFVSIRAPSIIFFFSRKLKALPRGCGEAERRENKKNLFLCVSQGGNKVEDDEEEHRAENFARNTKKSQQAKYKKSLCAPINRESRLSRRWVQTEKRKKKAEKQNFARV